LSLGVATLTRTVGALTYWRCPTWQRCNYRRCNYRLGNALADNAHTQCALLYAVICAYYMLSCDP